jgi:hypothetical protein
MCFDDSAARRDEVEQVMSHLFNFLPQWYDEPVVIPEVKIPTHGFNESEEYLCFGIR